MYIVKVHNSLCLVYVLKSNTTDLLSSPSWAPQHLPEQKDQRCHIFFLVGHLRKEGSQRSFLSFGKFEAQPFDCESHNVCL